MSGKRVGTEKVWEEEYDGFSLFEAKKGKLRGVESRNCDCDGGTLAANIGFIAYTLPSGKQVTADDTFLRMLYPVRTVDAAGELSETLVSMQGAGAESTAYRWAERHSAWSAVGTFGKTTIGLTVMNGQNSLVSYLFSTGKCMISTKAGFFFTTKFGDTVQAAACFCKDRLFVATSEYELSYSDPTDVEKIVEGRFDGGKLYKTPFGEKIVALQNTDDCVYIFYERSVERLDVTGSPDEFTFSKVAYTGGKIFPSSVIRVGEWLVFLAADGVYRLQGSKAERFCEGLGLRPSPARVEVGCGRFLGHALLRFAGKDGLAYSVAVDPERGTGYYLDYLNGLTDCGHRSLCAVGGKVQRIDPSGTLPSGFSYYFRSERLDFGERERKTLKKLTFEGEGSFTLRVRGDGRERTYALKMQEGIATCLPLLRGEGFAFTFELEKGCVLRKMRASLVCAQGGV